VCASSTTSTPAPASGNETLGRLATYVRDRRIPLELCPTSNVNTGVVPSIAEHPIGMLRRLRFRVTVNTDNRLMSDTSMTKEMQKLHEAFGWGLDDFEWLTVNADEVGVRAVPRTAEDHQRVIKPRYCDAQVRTVARSDLTWPSRRSSSTIRSCTDALARIRDRDTPNALFRQNLERIGGC
jgi:hypothetical protein